MSLLREIQSSLVSESNDLGPVLLKLRLLSSKLGIDSLEEWVRFEAEGYPKAVDVPDYRKIGMAYTATFTGPFGSRIKNAPIPPFLVEKFAGENWTRYTLRQSIASIDDLVQKSGPSGSLTIDSSNLTLLLQGNVYPDYECNAVYGHLSKSALVEVQNAVRSRILELTIQMEKSAPDSAKLKLDQSAGEGEKRALGAAVGNFHQIVYGNYTSINNSGNDSQIVVAAEVGNINSFVRQLVEAGLPQSDAEDLASIVESERPDDSRQSFGKKAKQWLVKNLCKAVDGTWKMGLAVATSVLEEAAKRYYGLS